MDPDALPWLALVGAALAVGALALALRDLRRKRLIEMIPTSKTTGVFIGLVELKGEAVVDAPLVSHLAGVACVYHVWSVEEGWSRTVHYTTTDSKGNTTSHTRQESGWTTVASGGEQCDFRLRDDAGEVGIVPDGAEIQALEVFARTCGRSDPLYYDKGPANAIADSDHRRRFSERAIPVGAPIYVIGQARECRDRVEPEIAYDRAAPLFVISTRREESVEAGYAWAVWGWGFAGLVVAALAGVAMGEARGEGRFADPGDALAAIAGHPSVIAAAAAYLLLWLLGWTVTLFNALIDLRQRVRQAWANIDVQLKRRADLIPRLLAIVTGLADHERTVQREIAGLRSQMLVTPPGRTGPDYATCAAAVGVLAERYPQLVADDAFTGLSRAIGDCEDRIALARGYFNDIAAFYNARLEMVPSGWIARLGGLRRQPLLAATAAEAAPPTVAR